MRKEKQGRPRKVGVPTRKSGQALARRYYRALARVRSGEKLISKYRNDMLQHLAYLENNPHGQCQKAAIKVRKDIEYYIGDHLMAAKKSAAKTAETKAENLMKKYTGIIESLQEGTPNDEYTILPTSKAKINTTVKFLVEIDEETSLCAYKK